MGEGKARRCCKGCRPPLGERPGGPAARRRAGRGRGPRGSPSARRPPGPARRTLFLSPPGVVLLTAPRRVVSPSDSGRNSSSPSRRLPGPDERRGRAGSAGCGGARPGSGGCGYSAARARPMAGVAGRGPAPRREDSRSPPSAAPGSRRPGAGLAGVGGGPDSEDAGGSFSPFFTPRG